MNNISIKTEGETKVLEIREGAALPLKEPVKLRIEGNFDAVSRFIKQRISNIDELSAHILVDREAKFITLVMDETSHYAGSVIAKLELTEVFKNWGINTDTTRTTFELADFFKMNRAHFEKPSDAANLIQLLNNFKAKVDKEVEASDDRRGNKTAMIRQIVNSNIPSSFNLKLPIFKGLPEQTIEVEIYISELMNCQLISPAANEFIQSITNSVFDVELARVSEVAPNIVQIEK